MIMSVNFFHRPAERAEFFRERRKIEHLLHPAEALDFVVIHEGDEIVEPVMRSEKNRLPI